MSEKVHTTTPKGNAFSEEEYIVGILSVFEVDSSRLNLTFVAFYVSFVNNIGRTI